jgi:hypothetical protein
LTEADQRALRAGRRALLLRLAYAELSEYQLSAARRTLGALIRQERLAEWRAYVLWVVSLLPTGALRGLYAGKRALRGAARRMLPQ